MSSRAYFQIPSVDVVEYAEELDTEHDHSMVPRPRQSRIPDRRLVLGLAIVVPWCLLLILSIWVLFQYRQRGPQNPIFPQMLYSPAQGALEYEVRRFHLSLPGDTTEYQGPPSPELDKRWSDLYEMGISLIGREDAAKLPNKTVIFPHDPERRYIVELDVFHQLHCLNMLRMALHPEYYRTGAERPDDEDDPLGEWHLSHCLDSIRQSIMCNPDISAQTWVWDETRQRHHGMLSVLHTCRRFDRIQEWARGRANREAMDYGYREMNDPLWPETWEAGFEG